MIKTVKKALPVVVFIILAAGAFGLWSQLEELAILVGGMGAALIISLLFYAVICWDDEYVLKKKEKRQLANVVDHAMDAVVIFDSQGLILYANPSACRSYSIQRKTTQQQTPAMIALTDQKQEEVLKEVSQDQPWNGELKFTKENQQKLTHLVNIFKLEEFHGHAPAVVSIGRDLSQRKELEKKLAHSQKLAAVGELASGVSHEINNPMAAIQSQIGLARDLLMLHQQPAEQSYLEILACIDETDKQVKRCSQIIKSLLRFSRRQEPQASPINPHQAIEQAIAFLRSLPKMKNVDVVYQGNGTTLSLWSDANSISQILINLLVNAADAIELNGVIRIETQQISSSQLAIKVIDHGCGITSENIGRVFEPFFTTKPPGKGTGLGLSISYGIAESLGGELSIHCHPRGGTCATLTLPFDQASCRQALSTQAK